MKRRRRVKRSINASDSENDEGNCSCDSDGSYKPERERRTKYNCDGPSLRHKSVNYVTPTPATPVQATTSTSPLPSPITPGLSNMPSPIKRAPSLVPSPITPGHSGTPRRSPPRKYRRRARDQPRFPPKEGMKRTMGYFGSDHESDHDSGIDDEYENDCLDPDETYGMTDFLGPRVPFSFNMKSFPRPGTRFAINVKGEKGKCVRMFKINRLDALRRPLLICLNCVRMRRRSKENGDIHLQPVRQYAYLRRPGGEDNDYEFMDNPFERHSEHCMKDKFRWAEYGLQHSMRNGLHHYKQNPIIDPIHPFNEARRQVMVDMYDSTLITDFDEQVEHDMLMLMPHWTKRNSSWTKARADRLPKFVFDDIDDIYKYSLCGQQPKSPLYRERFIVKAHKGSGYMFMMTDTCARHAITGTHLIGDGTFRAVKTLRGIQQLYTFHVRTLSGETVPIAFFLLPSKDHAMYLRMFRHLKRKLLSVNGTLGNLEIILCDWEKAIDMPCRVVFPELQRKYCSFHYGQSIIRGLGRHGLLSEYRRGDPIVRRYVHAVLGGMLIPTEFIDDYCELMEIVPDHDNVDIRARLVAFKEYCCEEYFRDVDRRSLLDSFSIKDGYPRTTNAAEGYHSALYASLRIHGSDLRRLIVILSQIEYNSSWRLYQLADGDPPRKRKEIYVRLDARINQAKAQIVGILTRLRGTPGFYERLRRWARYASYLLGSAKHAKLIGNLNDDLEDLEHDLAGMEDEDEYTPEEIINLPGVNIDPVHINYVDLIPFISEDEDDENDA